MGRLHRCIQAHLVLSAACFRDPSHPAASVAVVLVLVWRREWIGAVLFAAVGMLYMLNVLRHLNWILMISGALFLIAVLFLVSWLKRAELDPRPLRH
jgi:hypothetical protein